MARTQLRKICFVCHWTRTGYGLSRLSLEGEWACLRSRPTDLPPGFSTALGWRPRLGGPSWAASRVVSRPGAPRAAWGRWRLSHQEAPRPGPPTPSTPALAAHLDGVLVQRQLRSRAFALGARQPAARPDLAALQLREIACETQRCRGRRNGITHSERLRPRSVSRCEQKIPSTRRSRERIDAVARSVSST